MFALILPILANAETRVPGNIFAEKLESVADAVGMTYMQVMLCIL